MRLDHRLVFRNTPENRKAVEAEGFYVGAGECDMFFQLHVSDKAQSKLRKLKELSLQDDVTIKYETDELSEAQWLIIRPAWQQYGVTNFDSFTRPCPSCTAYGQQKNDVVLTAAFKKLKRPFLLPGGLNEILVDANLQGALLKSKLTGFSFRRVCAVSEQNEFLPMVQMVIHNLLPPAIVNQSADYACHWVCPGCGTSHRILKPGVEVQMDKQVMAAQKEDIYKTSEYFGERVMTHKFVISRKFYQFLLQSGIHKGIVVDSIVRLVS